MKAPYPSQWAAIGDASRHVLVVAGAGTGKTFTVVQRILYTLGVEVNGERHPLPATLDEIAAITFTNQAARELKNDLRQALRATGRRQDAYRVDQAMIGTIHGFCAELLRENALRRGRSPITSVLEEGESVARATQAARDALVTAVEQESVEGLGDLLAMWDTGKIDRWVVDLMRHPDLLARLETSPDGLDARERALIGLARLALGRLEADLERDGDIDFDRMILWTRDLLREDASARRFLQHRLRLLLIDEFQDVDPAQKEIAYCIGEPGRATDTTPRLMLVGDPKQSIYRFRRADVTVWNAVEREFEEWAGCAVHPLEENFRSVPAILAFVDSTVGVLLDQPIPVAETDGDSDMDAAGTADHEVRYRPVKATRTAAETTRAGDPGATVGVAAAVELLVTPAKDDGKSHSIDDVRAAEAASIARRARELSATGVAWRDMALLLASWAPEPVYTAALRAEGAPVYVLRDEGFYERREVVDLVIALQTVRDPMDDLALMGFLRGPFIGLRDDSLLAIATQARPPYWPKLRDVDLPSPDENERLARAIDMVWRFIELRDRVPAADLLEAMVRESGFLAHFALMSGDGRQAIGNVRRFLSLARATNTVSAGDLLRTIREAREREDRVEQARLFAASEDVLLITSIHVSKGLEWPVVFWANGSGIPPGFNEELLVGRDTIRLGTPEVADDEAPDWRALRDRLKREAEAERRRLWYVAATRAKDRLIVGGIGVKAQKNTLASELLGIFPSLSEEGVGSVPYTGSDGHSYVALVRAAPVLTENRATVDRFEVDAARLELDAARLALPPEPVPSPVGLTRHSATEILSRGRCARRHKFKYVLGIREPPIEATGEQLVSAVARGQIVHDVLERFEQEAELDTLLEDAIGRWDENAPAPESDRGRLYREHLTDEVTRVLEHEEYAAMATRPGARRELPFLQVLHDGSAVQGFVDLAAPAAAGNGIELLDVKTTQCDASAARVIAEQYSPQRDVYTTAVEAIGGQPATRFAFQFSRARTQIAADLDDGARAEAAARVDAFVRATNSGESPLTSFPDECGFCGYRRVGLCPGVTKGSRDPETVLRRLRQDRFRRSFRLGTKERQYLGDKGLATALEHARDFIAKRLAPSNPDNDGRQTPWRGHPVFVAQHATATCCRACLEQWHGIARGRELTMDERDYVQRVIEAWLTPYGSPPPSGPERGAQLQLL